MGRRGRARAPGAGTILNALATGTGSAFAIAELETEATVELTDARAVTGEVVDEPEADTSLIERCVERVLESYAGADVRGGRVRTKSSIPMAAGLKSSSAAANATVLATLDALDIDSVDPVDATRIGVQAARDAGVTVTGAFDDASASMLGGVTVTDNRTDTLLAHEAVEWDVVIWTPPERAFSADADIERCKRIAPMADIVAELAMQGRYGDAMTVNGLAYCAALGFPTDPLLAALPAASGVSLSGTGPSYVAIGDRESLQDVADEWRTKDGRTWVTTTDTTGATRI